MANIPICDSKWLNFSTLNFSTFLGVYRIITDSGLNYLERRTILQPWAGRVAVKALTVPSSVWLHRSRA